MNYDEREQEPLTTPDTNNQTRINASEGTNPVYDSTKWDRLSSINTGIVDSFGNRNESEVRRQERAVAFDIVSDRLYLTDHHKREGRELIQNEIDTQQLSEPQSDIYLVCFALAAILVNRDYVDRAYHPERSDDNNDTRFLVVADELGLDENKINRFMQKVGGQL